MNARLTRLAALSICAAVAGYLLTGRESPPPAQAAGSGHYFAFVRSTEGTTPDGAQTLKQDDAGTLVVDAELVHLFDYYLAGLGETSLESVRAAAERELGRRLHPAAAREARRLLGRYLDYKRALAALERGVPHSGNMALDARARLDGMKTLRRQYFSAEEARGLFGEADADAEDTIARLEIAADPRLDSAGRAHKLAALDAQMPPALREQREAPLRIVRLEETVAKRRAEGADDNEIYRLRAATLDAGAAARLADLDREEAAWQRRMQAYLAERKALLARSGDAQALQALRDASFSPEEQRRLSAYE
jgi:lipase chaperone LimK